ncbi:lipid A deacylase PagL precursor [mine drainage metagenome]|uniref:Lipid A deacylase PagL n=1 Tax=mine drainage metagenome TaxID=410659 RepID=A0A1J5RHG5_9ZZZZ
MSRLLRLLCTIPLLLLFSPAHAAEWTALWGGADGAHNAALARQGAPFWRSAGGTLDASLELSAGLFTRDGDHVWHVGVTPVLRWWMTPSNALEAGIGANLLSSTWIGPKGMSTAYQFGDLLGVVHRFDGTPWSVGARFTHYSNAGIKHPNPGQNFIQLRVSYDFD